MSNLYLIEAEEIIYKSFYVRADSAEEAEEDGRELMAMVEVDDDEEYDFRVTQVERTPGFGRVWSGGPDGDWE